MNDMYIAFTDGACKPNPGTGGYAVVLVVDGEIREEYAEAREDTTNNRMEFEAVIKAMELLPANCNAMVVSDSKYIVNSITRSWKRNANLDLWKRFDELREQKRQTISWWWEKGHAGNRFNERADELAQQAAEKLRREVDGEKV